MIPLLKYYERLPSIHLLNGLKVYNTYREEYGYISDDNISNWSKIGSLVFVADEKDGDTGFYVERDNIMVVE